MTLTNFSGTDTPARMGRPPLNVKETKVRLTDEQRQRIEALVGPNRMAAFIREADQVHMVNVFAAHAAPLVTVDESLIMS